MRIIRLLFIIFVAWCIVRFMFFAFISPYILGTAAEIYREKHGHCNNESRDWDQFFDDVWFDKMDNLIAKYEQHENGLTRIIIPTMLYYRTIPTDIQFKLFLKTYHWRTEC